MKKIITFNTYIKDLVVKPYFQNGEWFVLYRFDSNFGYFTFKDKSKDKVYKEYQNILAKMQQLYLLYSQVVLYNNKQAYFGR